MPTLKRKAADEASLARRLAIVSHFDEICKAIHLRRKWIPDVVFAGVINNLFNINVDTKELNKALNTCRGLELDDPSNIRGKFRETFQMHDPTSTSSGVNRRIVNFYYICNHFEKPHIMFGPW